MKRKFIILSFILFGSCNVLFLSCKQKNGGDKNKVPETKTSLVIHNQSSALVKAFKYNGKTLVGEKDIEVAIGEKCEILLDGESSSYVFFSIVDTLIKKEIKVRSTEVITVQKGESADFRILDTTSVLPIGETKTSTIFSILHPARLKVVNQTAASISDLNFGGKTHRETVARGSSWDVDFNSEVSSKLSFKLWDSSNNSIQVTFKDEITLKIDETKEVILTNESLVTKDKGADIEAIKTVLGLGVLRIVNKTNAKNISKIKYGKISSNEVLAPNATLELYTCDATNDYLEFELVPYEIRSISVKTEGKISLAKTEEKILILDDKTKVVGIFPDVVSDSTEISSFLDAVELEFCNLTSVALINVQMGDSELYSLGVNECNSSIFWDHEETYVKIGFEFEIDTGYVEVHTKDNIRLIPGKLIKYTFTNSTCVIKDGTNEEMKIKTLLGMTTLEVVNRTTARSIADIRFGGEKWEKDLKKSEIWEVDFDGDIENFLEFNIVSEITTFQAKIKNKVVVPKGTLLRFEITNDKVVMVDTGDTTLKTFTIREVLDMAELDVINDSSVDLLNVTYYGRNWGNIDKDDLVAYIYYKPPITGTLTFQINTSEGLVTLQENVTLNKGQKFQLKITNYKRFYRADVNKRVSINELI